MVTQQLAYERSDERFDARVVPASWNALKRGFDLAFSLAVLTLASPILLAACVGIIIVSPGSPFFVQKRVGKDGKHFSIYKLRTMVDGAHLMHEQMAHLNEATGPVFKMKRDPRLHSLGSILRKTSIDELPNFASVLVGDMSVVGPRPPLPVEVANYDAKARRRLTVKPGITCLWQISGRSDLDFDTWMDLDNRYIDTWSPLGDVAIVLATVPAVLLSRGAR